MIQWATIVVGYALVADALAVALADIRRERRRVDRRWRRG